MSTFRKPLLVALITVLLSLSFIPAWVGKWAWAQTTSLQQSFVYDRFVGPFIDPQKWATSAFSFCNAQTTLDCSRELLQGKLHLAIRTYGNTASDQGIQFDTSFLNFTNPANVKAMAANVVIANDEDTGCPTSSDPTHSHFILTGRFFNTGTGNFDDDMEGFIIVERFQDLPGLAVSGFLKTAGQFFDNTFIGNATEGDDIVVTLRWDNVNHGFAASLQTPNAAPIVVFMPYSQSDSAPPSFAQKQMGVRNFVANCTSQATVASMQANVKRVSINFPAP